MSKLLWLFYSLSVIVTVIIFYFINYFTEPILIGNTDNSISNGNPGLFPLVFLSPFLIVSIFGTFKLAYFFAERSINTMQFKIVMIFSFIFSIIVYFLTFKDARELRLVVFDNNDSVTEIAEIPLLNTYSNSIFFNGWTLLALGSTIFLIVYFLTLVKKRIR